MGEGNYGKILKEYSERLKSGRDDRVRLGDLIDRELMRSNGTLATERI